MLYRIQTVEKNSYPAVTLSFKNNAILNINAQ